VQTTGVVDRPGQITMNKLLLIRKRESWKINKDKKVKVKGAPGKFTSSATTSVCYVKIRA
jgi:hypothetical protein